MVGREHAQFSFLSLPTHLSAFAHGSVWVRTYIRMLRWERAGENVTTPVWKIPLHFSNNGYSRTFQAIDFFMDNFVHFLFKINFCKPFS